MTTTMTTINVVNADAAVAVAASRGAEKFVSRFIRMSAMAVSTVL
jgi:hypothetical protein